MVDYGLNRVTKLNQIIKHQPLGNMENYQEFFEKALRDFSDHPNMEEVAFVTTFNQILIDFGYSGNGDILDEVLKLAEAYKGV